MRSFTVNRTLEINYLHILPAVTTSCLGCIDFALELWWCIEYVSELLYPWAPPPPTERTSWPGCSIPPVTLWLRVDNSEEGESIFFLWRDLLEIIYKLHYHCVKVCFKFYHPVLHVCRFMICNKRHKLLNFYPGSWHSISKFTMEKNFFRISLCIPSIKIKKES